MASSDSQRQWARSRCPVAACKVSEGRMGSAAAKSLGKRGKVLRIPIPEAWESPRGQVEARDPRPVSRPLLLFTWLGLAGGPLGKPHGAGPWVPHSTPARRTPPPSLPPGASSRPAASVNLQPKRGAPLREFVSRKGSKPSSIGAYVHRAINRKDLQSSPGPQQPRTLSGITYDDLSHQPGQLSH